MISPGQVRHPGILRRRRLAADVCYVVQPKPGGPVRRDFPRAAADRMPDEPVLVGLPDTIWFPEDGARAPCRTTGCPSCCSRWSGPELFDAVVTDDDGRVQEIQVKQPRRRDRTGSGAPSRCPGACCASCTSCGCERERARRVHRHTGECMAGARRHARAASARARPTSTSARCTATAKPYGCSAIDHGAAAPSRGSGRHACDGSSRSRPSLRPSRSASVSLELGRLVPQHRSRRQCRPRPIISWATIPRQVAALRARDAGRSDAARRVLDIGCNAGFYSIEMKRARRRARGRHRLRSTTTSRRRGSPREVSGATSSSASCRSTTSAQLGEKFDVVLFMGVLYHLRHPLLALDLLHEHVVERHAGLPVAAARQPRDRARWRTIIRSPRRDFRSARLPEAALRRERLFATIRPTGGFRTAPARKRCCAAPVSRSSDHPEDGSLHLPARRSERRGFSPARCGGRDD